MDSALAAEIGQLTMDNNLPKKKTPENGILLELAQVALSTSRQYALCYT